MHLIVQDPLPDVLTVAADPLDPGLSDPVLLALLLLLELDLPVEVPPADPFLGLGEPTLSLRNMPELSSMW